MSHEEWPEEARRWPDPHITGCQDSAATDFSGAPVPDDTGPDTSDHQALGDADTGLARANLHVRFVGILTTLRRRRQKLSDAIQAMMLQQSQTHHGWSMCSSTRGYYEDSQEKLYQALTDNKSQIDSRIVELRAQVDADRDALLEQSLEIKAREENMIAVEDRAFQRANSFMAAVDHFMALLQAFSDDTAVVTQQADVESVEASLPDTEAELELDPELAEYYEEEGNVKILGERLVDLDISFEDTKVARDLQRDQGQLLEESDDALLATWLHDRAELERQIDFAIAEADRLRRVCLAKGLLPSDPVLRTLLPDIEILSPAPNDQQDSEAQTARLELSSRASRSHLAAYAPSIFTGRLDSSPAPERRNAPDMQQVNRKVVAWVNSVSTEQIPNEPRSEEEQNPTQSRSSDRARRSMIEPRSKSDASLQKSSTSDQRFLGARRRRSDDQGGLIRFRRAHSSA